MSFYHYPEIYAELLDPDPDLVCDVLTWVENALDAPYHRVLDPACGPGGWLLPFAAMGTEVVGNDLEPGMVAFAKKRLGPHGGDAFQGDMRELPRIDGVFDLALNLHASIGHLGEDLEVRRHLSAVASRLRSGSLYLLGLCIQDGAERIEQPEVLFQTEPRLLSGGGTAAVLYESVWKDPKKSREKIRILLLTHGRRDCPAVVREEYELRTFAAESIRDLTNAGSPFELVSVRSMEIEGRPEIDLAENCGDVTLLLRRRREH